MTPRANGPSCSSSSSVSSPRDLDRLAEIPLEQILEAQARLSARRSRRGVGGADMQAFSPAPDGTSLLEMPLEAIAAGSAADIPVIVGTNRDEIKLFAVWDVALQSIERDGAIAGLRGVAGDHASRLFDTYTATRPDQPASEVAMAIATDETFRLAAVQMAEAQHAVGNPAYLYLFTWQSPRSTVGSARATRSRSRSCSTTSTNRASSCSRGTAKTGLPSPR